MSTMHRLAVTEQFEWALPNDLDVSLSLLRLPGSPLGDTARTWKPIAFSMVSDPAGRRERLLEAQAPWCASNVIVAKQPAVTLLTPLLEAFGTWLPLSWPGGELWVWICERQESAVDQEASTIRRFRDGRIMRIDELVWSRRPEGAFVLAEQPTGPLYFGDSLRKALEELSITGLHLVPVPSQC